MTRRRVDTATGTSGVDSGRPATMTLVERYEEVADRVLDKTQDLDRFVEHLGALVGPARA